MLWCPRCERNVDVNRKTRKLGRTKLVQVITTCAKCRTNLSTKTMTAQAAEALMNPPEENVDATETPEEEESEDTETPEETEEDEQ